MPDHEALAGVAEVGVTPGPDGAPVSTPTEAKIVAAVDFQRRVLESADEAVDRAQAKLAKLRATAAVDIAGAELGIEQALAAREAAMADYEAAQAAASGGN